MNAAPITDDDVAFLVVVLRRTGLGVSPLALHLNDEGVAHEVATVLAEFGPTWVVPLYEAHVHRYTGGGEAAEAASSERKPG